jgi:hypothetical protein
MSLSKKILCSIGQAKVFNILDLLSKYHSIPFYESDNVKIAFWVIDKNGKDYLYQWKFLSFGLKNAPI